MAASSTASVPGRSTQSGNDKNSLCIVGINVTHTVAPPMHNYIAQALGLSWNFSPHECPTVEDVIRIFGEPSFAGGVVTMPYKKTIMSYLDELDPLALSLGACNNVYITPEGNLRGTNTDWRGIKGCLLDASSDGVGKPALIIGAGGASRAAVYALLVELQCSPIYIINRDEGEVLDLIRDVKSLVSSSSRKPEVVHIKTVSEAEAIFVSPFYIVGTVPDFEASTPQEKAAVQMLTTILSRASRPGVLLDMCFKPRVTRNIKLGQKLGWQTVEGTGIIGHQIEEQWRLWTGKILTKTQQQEAWAVLRKAAEESPAINF